MKKVQTQLSLTTKSFDTCTDFHSSDSSGHKRLICKLYRVESYLDEQSCTRYIQFKVI